MNFTPEHLQFRSVVREFVEREINPQVESWEQQGRMPLKQVFSQMADLGFLGLEYDKKYGGQEADRFFTVILSEELGRADHGSIGMAVGVQADMATPSLHKFGSEELKERYLQPALAGEAVCSIAVTEPDAGSDVASIKTRAIRDGDQWVINGSKMYITNAVQADWVCLLARTSDENGYGGMSQIIVPTSTKGFEVSEPLHKLGMHASDTGLISLNEVMVPVENVIGEEGRGFQQQMAQFVLERMWATYSVVGACERALERTAEYCRGRKVFGKPILSHQYVQYKLAELSAEVDLLKHYNYACVQAYKEGADPVRFATIAKLKSGRLIREVGDWVLQFHGGLGYMEEHWTARFYRDNRLASIGGGSDETMLQVLAGLDGFQA